MTQEVSRRDFLARLGVTVGTAAVGAAAAAGVPLAALPLVSTAHAQPKGNIPDTPYKTQWVGGKCPLPLATNKLGEAAQRRCDERSQQLGVAQ